MLQQPIKKTGAMHTALGPRRIERGGFFVIGHRLAFGTGTASTQTSGTTGGDDGPNKVPTNKIRQRRPLSCHTLALPDLVFIVGHLKVTNQSEGWRYEVVTDQQTM